MPFDLYGPTIPLLAKVLDLRAQRHNMISSNIANADTPGYKAGEVRFEDELQKLFPAKNRLSLATNDPRHMPQAGADFSDIKPTVTTETGSVQRIDGNTVDLDREVVEMSKNQLMYGAITQIIRKKFEGLETTIKDVK